MTHIYCLVPQDNSEEIVAAYRRYKEKCVDHLYKEFSFVIHDTLHNSYFAARDPLGLRPLYYTKHNNQYFFSRDIETLFKDSCLPKRPNRCTMESMVHHSRIPYTETMFEGIQRLGPGHHLTISSDGQPTIKRYWKPENIKINHRISDVEAIETFRLLFDQAISERIDGQRVVGCELSGGLDSSSILTWLKKYYPSLHTTALSMTFESLDKCNETAYVELIEKKYDLSLVKIPVDKLDYRRARDLESYYRLNPYWPIFITNTLGLPLVEAAKEKGIRTILTGQGGDHLMSGNYFCLYDYFRQFRWKLLYDELKVSKDPYFLIKRFILLPLLGKKGREAIRSIIRSFRRKGVQPPIQQEIPFTEYSENYDGNSPAFRYDLSQVIDSTLSALIDSSYYQFAESKYDIEFRHPFFDRRLVEFMLSLPAYHKLKRGQSKILLRKAMKGVLPEEIRLRTDKATFNEILRQQIDAIDLDSLLKDAYIARMGIIDQKRIDQMKDRYQKGNLNHIIYLWHLLNLEYWYRFHFTA